MSLTSKYLARWVAILCLSGLVASGNLWAVDRMGMGGSGMAADQKSDAAPAEADRFMNLWMSASDQVAFSDAQYEQLRQVLRDTAMKLRDNWKAWDGYRQQRMVGKTDKQATLQRRIDLLEAERDLIISQAETKLKEFLNADQVDVVMAAGFHGVSRSHGEGMAMQGMQEANMELERAAQAMNRDFQANSLDIISQ